MIARKRSKDVKLQSEIQISENAVHFFFFFNKICIKLKMEVDLKQKTIFVEIGSQIIK